MTSTRGTVLLSICILASHLCLVFSEQPPPTMDLPSLPTLPITSKETLRKCRELPVSDKDVFICSFPKSGTTWMQNIVYQLLACERSLDNEPNKSEELPFDHISQYAPFYEIDPHWQQDDDDNNNNELIETIQAAHAALGYRIFNTHLRWDMLPTQQDGCTAKYIYVVRDGRDVLTSFYHHMTNQHVEDGGFAGDFEAFFQQFLEGTIAYGKWSHHLASWMPHCTVGKHGEDDAASNILLVRYEDLKANLEKEVVRIADFLNLKGVQEDKTGASMARVLERVSFDWMRKNQELFHPISVRWKPGYNFIRKGSIGDHESIFDEQRRKKFVESVEKDFGDKEKVPGWLQEYCYHN